MLRSVPREVRGHTRGRALTNSCDTVRLAASVSRFQGHLSTGVDCTEVYGDHSNAPGLFSLVPGQSLISVTGTDRGMGGWRSAFTRRELILTSALVPGFLKLPHDGSLNGSAKRETGTRDSVSDSNLARSAVSGTFAPTIPTNVDDPFLVTTHGQPPLLNRLGWESADREAVRRAIFDLGPDVFSVQDQGGFSGPPVETINAYRHKKLGLFSNRYDLPQSTSFQTLLLKADQVNAEWYQDLPPEQRYQFPDGTPIDDIHELAARNFYDGRRALGSDVVPSVFAPGTVDLKSRTGGQMLQLGLNQLFIDGTGIGRITGADFSPWALSTFQTHLEGLSETRLRSLGIEDPAAFDIRAYLTDNGLAPGDTSTPATDPVYREFQRVQHAGNKRFVSDLVSGIRDRTPAVVREAGTTIFGNQAGLAVPVPFPIYISDVLEEINIEVTPTLPPDNPHDITAKVARAAGRFETPVRIEGKMHRIRAVDTVQGLDPGEQYPTLMQLQVAQAYAHGAIRGLSLSSWGDVHNEDVVNNWIRGDGTIDEQLQQFADFVRAHRRFLDDGDGGGRTVLAVSLPTLVWERAPQWNQYRPPHARAIRGLAHVLRRAHVPYDVRILDYPPLWDAREQAEQLMDYDTVLLPSVVCVSDRHVEAIEGALAGGSTVIATGGAPTRSEEYQARDDLRRVLSDSEAATILEESPAPDSSPGTASTQAVRDAISTTTDQIDLGTETDVSVNVLAQPEENRVVVHLVNFEYDSETDSVETLEGLDVTVRGLPFDPGVCTWRTIDGRSRLSLSGDRGESSFTVPRLDVWGFAVLGASEEAVASPGSQAAAEGAADRAQSAISAADAAGRQERLAQAAVTLSNAKASIRYGAYDQGTTLSEAAHRLASAAYRPPTVAIDTAHGQPSAVTYDAELPQLRDTFDTYSYRTLDSWSDRAFSDVDLLIVPALGSGATGEYGFDATDLDRVQSFVRSGGSLLVLGIGRLKSGINNLTAPFGFEYDGRLVMTDRGDQFAHSVRTKLSSVTQFAPNVGAKFGTVFSRVDDAVVMSRIRQDAPVWLHEEEPVRAKSTSEEAADGLPTMVATTHGRGAVVAVGDPSKFTFSPTAPGSDDVPSPFTELVLRDLGRRARYQQRSAEGQGTRTPTHTATGTPTSASGESTVEDSPSAPDGTTSPGFSLLTAAAGVGGALTYYLLRDTDDEES